MQKTWSNTMLVAYSLMPKIAKNIDKAVENRINSGFQSKHLKNGVSTEQLIGEIIQLNDEKRKIANLVYIVNTGLSRLKESHKDILIRRLALKKTFKEISQEKSIPMRTLFRRFDSAEQSFATILSQLGYDEHWLEKEYGDLPYIKSIKTRIDDEKYFVAEASKI